MAALFNTATARAPNRSLGDVNGGGGQAGAQITSAAKLRGGFEGLAGRHLNRISDTGQERGRVGGLASALAGQQQRTGTNQATTLNEALRISKARTGIVNRGEKAVENQNLKDRLTQVRRGIGRRGAALGAQGAAAEIKQGVNVARDASQQFADQSRADLFGGIAGAGIATLAGNRKRTGSIFDFGKKNVGNNSVLPSQLVAPPPTRLLDGS